MSVINAFKDFFVEGVKSDDTMYEEATQLGDSSTGYGLNPLQKEKLGLFQQS